MKRTVISLAAASGLATALLALVSHFTGGAWAEALAITFGTVFYHFAMRLLVGLLVDGRFHNRMDPERWWFRPRGFEPALYKALGVRRWKKRVPTFDPQAFRLADQSPEALLGATCQAEVVHELIMVLSFVPLAFAKWFGAFPVFLITSVLSCLLDGIFVVLQRFNRPRLAKLKARGK